MKEKTSETVNISGGQKAPSKHEMKKSRASGRSLMDGSLTVCVRCHLRAAVHFTRDKPRQRNLCCECFVEEGHRPSHWHPACRRAYRIFLGHNPTNL